MNMLRRVIFRRHGPAHVLEVVTVAEPQPGPDELLVDVAFAPTCSPVEASTSGPTRRPHA
jgi:NADPH:quinone reductase-like Zn-dependent oxidoreductase